MQEIPRRDSLKLAAGQAAAGFAPSDKSANKPISYVVPPEHVIPGKVHFFATTCRAYPAGCGMHRWDSDGRVRRPRASSRAPSTAAPLRARAVFAARPLLPGPLRGALQRQAASAGSRATGPTAVGAIGKHICTAAGRVVFLSDLQAGALADVMDAFSAAFDVGPPLLYEPFHYEPQRAAHDALFGRPAVPDYRIDDASPSSASPPTSARRGSPPVQFARWFAQMHAYHDKGLVRFADFGPRLSVTAAKPTTSCRRRPAGRGRWRWRCSMSSSRRAGARHDLGDLGRLAAALAGLFRA